MPHPVLVLHDLRRWSDTGHWTQSSLALEARKLRGQSGIPTLRTFCFLWEWGHPGRWRFVLRRSAVEPDKVLTGRGRMRGLTDRDWLPDGLWAPVYAWEPWFGRQNPLEPPTPQQAPTSSLGDPTQFGAGSRFAALPLQDQIVLAYWIRAGRPDPEQWRKLLPPVIPEESFFQVYDWKRIALQLSLTV